MQLTLIINYSPKRPVGGPQGVAYDTVEGLKKNHDRLEKEDIQVHIMSSMGTDFQSTFETDEKFGNITYEYFRKIVPTAVFSDLNYYLHIKKRRDEIDLIHSHPISGAVAGAFLHLPRIFTLHGMYWKEKLHDPYLYSRLMYGDLNIRRFRYVSSRIKKLIAISPYVISEVDQFLKTGIPPVEVIENPVSDIFFEQEKQEKEGLLLFPGMIDPRKNQSALIKALDLLKKDKVNFHCVLPGPIVDQDYYESLKSLIKKYGLEQEVTIPGIVPFEHLLTLYRQAGILVLTSLQETAPMIISEAMAGGTPVVASRVSGIPYMVSEGNSGYLINPDSPEGVARHLALLLTDDALRKKFGAESRRIAESRWKCEVIVNKQLQEYGKILT
jgi:glycosyltransferase involved in cell wall biosynthesis